MFRRKSDESVTFHVHALQTHKAVVITGKWLAKPISQAMIGSFLDQVRAPGPIGQHATQVPMGDVSSLEAVPAVCHSNEDLNRCLSVCQMNAEPGTVKKWKLDDISRVVADGVEFDVRRLTKDFARDDGEPVQLVLEFREDPMAQRKADARRTARRSHGGFSQR